MWSLTHWLWGGDGWDVSLAMIFSPTVHHPEERDIWGDESWKLLRSGEGEGLQLLELLIDSVPFCPLHIIPHGQSTWHSPQNVDYYRAYINQYMVTVPSTFTLVYIFGIKITSKNQNQLCFNCSNLLETREANCWAWNFRSEDFFTGYS